MLEFEENRPRRKRLPSVLKNIRRVLLLAATLFFAWKLIISGRDDATSTTDATDTRQTAPAEANAVDDLRFGPSDEWLKAYLSKLDNPTIADLDSLVRRSPYSLELLRYLSSIASPKAKAAVNARILDLTPHFSRKPAGFANKIFWRGSRRPSVPANTSATSNCFRHYFTIPANATENFSGLTVRTSYLNEAGSVEFSEDILLLAEDIFVLSFSATSNSLEFFIDRDIPEKATPRDSPWSLDLGILHNGTPLATDALNSPDGHYARIDFLQ